VQKSAQFHWWDDGLSYKCEIRNKIFSCVRFSSWLCRSINYDEVFIRAVPERRFENRRWRWRRRHRRRRRGQRHLLRNRRLWGGRHNSPSFTPIGKSQQFWNSSIASLSLAQIRGKFLFWHLPKRVNLLFWAQCYETLQYGIFTQKSKCPKSHCLKFNLERIDWEPNWKSEVSTRSASALI
jgi:hypothetical protein